MSNLNFLKIYKEGLHIEWLFSFTAEDMKVFSKLSQDFNEIHIDTAFAKTKGFHAPLVQGLLLSSQMSRLIGQELPDKNSILTSIKMNFNKPCFPDDQLIFASDLKNISPATYSLEFDCKILRDSDILCRGEVNAIWKP